MKKQESAFDAYNNMILAGGTDEMKVAVSPPYQLPEDWFEHEEDFYFPINTPQIKNLLGKLLTHIEAINLPERVEKANKDLINQTIWTWFGDVQENSITSYQGCIAPIELPRTPDHRIGDK